MKKTKVAVGLSGGVDSAVSAYLLKKQGFDVSGVYLRCFDDDAPGCRGKQDRQDALSVALHLKIPFQVLDFRRQYKSSVIGYFKKEYLAGRTPNPDVVCNRDIKFGLLLDWCVKNSFDYLATGHYAKLVGRTVKQYNSEAVVGKSVSSKPVTAITDLPAYRPTDYRPTVSPLHRSTGANPVFLSQPKDLHKDQTYFLWAVPRQNFSRVLFPLADFRKQDVRSVAKFAKIPVADKPDSTGICFIGEIRVEDFLKQLGVKEKVGEVVIRVCNSENIMTSKTVERYNSETVVSKSVNNKPVADITDKPAYRSTDYRPTVSLFHRHTDSCYRVIGSHHGVAFYTIGQRRGFSTDLWSSKNKDEGQRTKDEGNTGASTPVLQPLAFSLQPSFSDRPPLYVIAKDVRRNRLIVGFGPETYRDNFEVSDCNWLVSDFGFRLPAGEAGISDFPRVSVRIRHLGDLIPCSLSVNSEQLTVNRDSQFTVHDSPFAIHRSRFTVHPRFAQRGIAAGQSAVFYSKDGLVLGGGVIQ